MDDSVTRNYKIKVISFIFETRYNDKLSEKVLSIINNNNHDTLDYTTNNNGIFINLNTISNNILDMIYYVVQDYEKEVKIHEGTNEGVNYISKPSIDHNDVFTKRIDTIMYSNVDNYLLQLSTKLLTI